MHRSLVVLLAIATQTVLAEPTFHGNIARTGVYESAGPVRGAHVKWTFKTGGPIVGSAAVADGTVYMGSADNFLYALDQETGKEKWKFKTLGGRAIASTPAVADGLVYVEGFDGILYALAADTGAQKWMFTAEYERRFEAKRLHGYTPGLQTIPDSWDIYTSSPAVFNGRVYFGSGDGNVYAVNAKTGVLQWKATTGDVVHASPAIASNTVYIGSWDSYLYAFDAESGQEKWRFKAGDDPFIHNQQGFQSSAAVADGIVYVGCRDGHLYAIDAATGRKKWDYPTNKGWVNGTPAIRDGVVYVGTSDGYRFFALDAKTGRARFNVDAKGAVFSSPAIAGDLVYFGVSNGKLLAVDAKTGALAWEFQTEASRSDPLKVLKPDGGLNNDVIYAPYFRDYQDMVLAFYRVFSVGAIWSSPVVSRGTLYFGSTDGNVYALQ
jgi:eukaryotic-like serine/threonine-protein kinase